MKKSIILFIISLSTFYLRAQDNITYGPHGNLIKRQQKEILKKLKVKKVFHRFCDLVKGKNSTESLSDELVIFNSLGDPLKIIQKDIRTIKTWRFNYDASNTLKIKYFKEKKGRYAGYYSATMYMTRPPYPSKIHYTYDNQNRLVNKKSCEKNNRCKIEYIKYFKNKAHKYFTDVKGNIIRTEITKRKDSISIKLILDKNNEIVDKTMTVYNIDSLILRKEHVVRDTLRYKEKNTIENNRIVKEMGARYFKNRKSNEMKSSIYGSLFIYNPDSSLKKIIVNDKLTWRYEYQYNDKGLLEVINHYIDDEFRYSSIYEYEFW